MGRTANYALVVARTLIPDDDGELNDYGLGLFLVQVRDLKTHRHMPGIKSGEIGSKFGYTSKDNGWMTFDNVRVSRDQWLQRFVTIDEDGCFQIKGDPRMQYIVMLRTRVLLSSCSWFALMLCSIIGIRYSIVRR